MVTFFQALKHECFISAVQTFIIANWIALVLIYGLYENFFIWSICLVSAVASLVVVTQLFDTPDYINPPVEERWICVGANLVVYLSTSVLPRVLMAVYPSLLTPSKAWGLTYTINIMLSLMPTAALLRGLNSLVFIIINYFTQN